jgi:hypothetical protein
LFVVTDYEAEDRSRVLWRSRNETLCDFVYWDASPTFYKPIRRSELKGLRDIFRGR